MTNDLSDLQQKLSTLTKDELINLIYELTEADNSLYKKILSFLNNKYQFESEKILSVSEKVPVYLETRLEPQSIELFSPSVTRTSPAQNKINLYKSLFRGRNDVYSLRWENAKTGKSGHSPVCKNKWVQGKCNIKTRPCAVCPYNEPLPLEDSAFLRHFWGDDSLCRDVIGLYPLLPDNTCYFLALDFDEKDWKEDAKAIREVCNINKLPISVEISRSGNGAHLWFFFDNKISAKAVREFGEVILNLAINFRHQIPFSSFDRMFPNQDEMPKGGYGNLIALPLQGRAVKQGYSVFVDDDFIPYQDQWAYLSSIRKMSLKEVTQIIRKYGKSFETNLSTEQNSVATQQTIKAETVNIPLELSNGIHIKKQGIPEILLSKLKRTAVFQNPAYYQAVRMRLPTWDKPRYIDCSDENETELILPRGCLDDIASVITTSGNKYEITDNREFGTQLDVSFNGQLSEEQNTAEKSLLENETGVLSAGTGFGKTVIATSVIAGRKVNTLVIVHTHALLSQWKKSIKAFLNFDAGTIGGGKEKLTGKIDVAVIQSLLKKQTDEKKNNEPAEIKDLVSNYGMVIVDECHHISAFTFEQVLKAVRAKYVYGLTATPVRRDGHQPIIFFQCGPIRFKTNAKELAAEHGFSHYLIPRFSPIAPIQNEKDELSINDYYQAITENQARNKLICDDIKAAIAENRTPLVLSERVGHINELAQLLEGSAQNIILITGQGTVKEKREALANLNDVSPDESLIVLATGKYAGEGFDNPRLDTLFLTMPVSWKGTLQQYAGRLHREYEGKTEAQIYDYIDFKIPMLERMWQKRLKGYASLGYTMKSTVSENTEIQNALYNGDEFIQVLTNDISQADKSLFITSPYLTKNAVLKFMPLAVKLITNRVKIYIATKLRQESDRAKVIPLIEELESTGCIVKEISDLSQRCAVIDEKLIWYGSSDILGWIEEDDCMLRFEDASVAAEASQIWNKDKN